MITDFITFLRRLNWKFLIGMAVFAFLMAITNNLRVNESRQVEWIGTQPILEEP